MPRHPSTWPRRSLTHRWWPSARSASSAPRCFRRRQRAGRGGPRRGAPDERAIGSPKSTRCRYRARMNSTGSRPKWCPLGSLVTASTHVPTPARRRLAAADYFGEPGRSGRATVTLGFRRSGTGPRGGAVSLRRLRISGAAVDVGVATGRFGGRRVERRDLGHRRGNERHGCGLVVGAGCDRVDGVEAWCRGGVSRRADRLRPPE